MTFLSGRISKMRRRRVRAACMVATIVLVAAGSLAASAGTALRQQSTLAPARRTAHARFAVLHSFFGGNDGALPAAGLLVDHTGALYGTTQSGGGKNRGTVYKLTPSGSTYAEAVLHAFQGGADDGAVPVAGLIEDRSGTLFGTTAAGGIDDPKRGCSGEQYVGCGTVFSLAPSGSGYTENVLHRFRGNTSVSVLDGLRPLASLIADSAGDLYGPTFDTAFELSPSGSRYKESVLFRFPYSSSGDDYPYGVLPSGALLADDSGDLYGTAQFGGACPGHPVVGCGLVFELLPSTSGPGYICSIIYEFQGGADGRGPLSTLIADKSGTLYGTTQYGGLANQGTVFELTPSGSRYSESVVHTFTGGNDGALPVAGLISDKNGALYGTTPSGGSSNDGAIFKLTQAGSNYTETILYSFQGGADGAEPMAGLVRGKNGMYGTAMIGGASGVGTVFALQP